MSADIKDGGPASQKTLRDEFAAKALQGFCANPAVFQANPINGWELTNCTNEQLTHYCFVLADAMLRARATTGAIDG